MTLSPAAIVRFLFIAGVGLSIDLWTKSLAVARLGGGAMVDFVPGWIRFEYVGNHGAVFGIAQGQRWIFLLVSTGAVLFLFYLFFVSGRRWFYQTILALLLAGVLGNMYDRVNFGYVRDMVHALPGWRWPSWVSGTVGFLPVEVFPWIFNVADSLLCAGVGLMMIYSFWSAATTPTVENSVPVAE